MARQTRGHSRQTNIGRSAPGRDDLQRPIITEWFVGAGYPAPSDAQFSEVLSVLTIRLAEVESGPMLLADVSRSAGKVSMAAKKLRAALAGLPDCDLFLTAIEDAAKTRAGLSVFDEQPNARDLWEWIELLERSGQIFQPAEGAKEHHAFIASMEGMLEGWGFNVALHETAMFLRFLQAIDDWQPRMVFPDGTVAGGRYDYIRRATRRS